MISAGPVTGLAFCVSYPSSSLASFRLPSPLARSPATPGLRMYAGGWTDITQPVGPDGNHPVTTVGIPASILVGWAETNRRFPLTVLVLHEDGDELLKIEAQMEAGRPPGIPHGSDLRSLLAINAQLQFPKAGTYEVRAELETGSETKVRNTVFRVHAAPRPLAGSGPAAFRLPG